MARGDGGGAPRGVGRVARADWSGDRITPNPEQQVIGFYVGVVMDDQDDQRINRLWVYIPALSVSRFDENSSPTYGGTTPDRQTGDIDFDNKLRLGWIQCYPLLPYFGGDDYRVPTSPDGRNSQAGDTNAYGMQYQPRNGDTVGVLFDNNSPDGAFWIGCVPKQYRNFAVPGAPGIPRDQLGDQDNSNGAIKNKVNADAIIPAMDKARTNDNPTGEGPFVSTVMSQNALVGGLIYDPMRGAGTASARRESPSYVMGFKSAGWNYASEEYNKNVDGTQFRDNKSRYIKVNSVGHQFVMDDHPDYQAVRLRTSFGSQILFSDAGNTPYIYVNTAKGNLWIELVDNGDINVFGEGSFSLHARTDINLTADRNMNIEVFGNMNTLVHGNQTMEVKKRTDWQFGASGSTGHYILNHGDLNHTMEKNHNTLTGGNVNNTIQGGFYEYIEGDYNQFTNGLYNSTVGLDRNLLTSGQHNEDALTINMNSGFSMQATDPIDTQAVNFPALASTWGPPTTANIEKNTLPAKQPYLAPIVPQHQPWPDRTGSDTTFGTNGYVGASRSALADNGGTNKTCDQSNLANNYRRGAASPTATAPNTFTGVPPGLKDYAVYPGLPYQTNNLSETPQNVFGRSLHPEEYFSPGDLSTSQSMVDQIKRNEVFTQYPVLDEAGNLTIGYGHRIQAGDNIGGTIVTQDLLTQISKGMSSPLKYLQITIQQADQFLMQELGQVEGFVSNLFSGNFFTQNQYDSVVSMTRNVSPQVLTNTQAGRNYINAVKTGTPESINQAAMQFSYINGSISCDQVNRRRKETQNYSQDPDKTGIAGNNAKKPINPNAITKDGAKIDPEVYNAIQEACTTKGANCDYMMAMAGMESGFNPDAAASTSSAKGLYQFTDGTWAQYGDGQNVFDPQANANAAADLFNDNQNSLANGALNGVRDPNATDLYMAHFLGAGSVSSGTGANGFLNQAINNPNGIAANNPNFSSAASANPSIFYNKDGSGKTYSQIYNDFNGKMNTKLAAYGS